VLKPTVERNEALPAMRTIETEDAFGVEISAGGKAFRVVFNKDSLELPLIER
jgi:hypothetical protein